MASRRSSWEPRSRGGGFCPSLALSMESLAVKLRQNEYLLPGTAPGQGPINPGRSPSTAPQRTPRTPGRLPPRSTISFQRAGLLVFSGDPLRPCRVPAHHTYYQTKPRTHVFHTKEIRAMTQASTQPASSHRHRQTQSGGLSPLGHVQIILGSICLYSRCCQKFHSFWPEYFWNCARRTLCPRTSNTARITLFPIEKYAGYFVI